MLAEVASNSLLRQLANHIPGPDGAMPAIRTQRSPAALRRDLKAYIAQTRRCRACLPPLPDRLHRNLALCAKLMNLNAAEVAVIRFAIMLRVSAPLRELVRYWGEMPLRETSNIVAAASHMHVDKIHRALGYSGRLRGMDLLNTAYGDSTVARMVRLEAPFADLLLHPRLSRDTLIRQFVPISPPPALGWDDFAHLDRAKSDVLQLLEGALKTKQRGVNVLFYGATGAGKTALARVVAAKLSVPLYFVRFADDEGESASSHERSNAYALAQTLVALATGVVLFDEFDQVINGQRGSSSDYSPSKHWFNAQLEDNALPSIFICNDIDTLDAAHLRRPSTAL